MVRMHCTNSRKMLTRYMRPVLRRDERTSSRYQTGKDLPLFKCFVLFWMDHIDADALMMQLLRTWATVDSV
jgi:hypothetical protein